MKQTIATILAALLLLHAARVNAEPTVDEVRRVALHYGGLHGRVDHWSARSRLRHLLPELSVSVGQQDQVDDNTQFDEWLTRDGSEELLWDSARNQTEDNRRFRTDFTIRATMDLGGLLFDSHELAAARESRTRFEARRALVEAVHAAYFERLAAIDELRETDPRDFDQRREHVRHIRSLEASLDGLTGGWFGRQLRSTP